MNQIDESFVDEDYDDYDDYLPEEPRKNTLGLVGFILSLAGLLTVITAPIGFILSMIALKQEPKGLATAGAITGGILTLLFALAIPFLFVASSDDSRSDWSKSDLQLSAESVAEHLYNLGDDVSLLSSAEIGNTLEFYTDPWGRSWQLKQHEGNFQLISAGEDHTFGTKDDYSKFFSNTPED